MEMTGSIYEFTREKQIMHYSSSHKILLVGEGDFSFAVCLPKAFGSANNIVATSLDSKALVLNKHQNASANLKQLEEMGCTVLHNVDANIMGIDTRMMLKSFDRIVFNFPHAGFFYREHDSLQIKMHQDVVKGFLRNARGMLASNGEVHVTHKTAYPFSKWEIEKLAEEVELCLVEKAFFSLYYYPGYINKKGSGLQSDDTFPVGACCTFKFRKTFLHCFV